MTSIRVQRLALALKRTVSTGWLIAAMLVVALAGNVATAQQTERLAPVYWKQRLFFIPYQPNQRDPLFGKIEKVQLLVSRSGGAGDWRPLQDAKPNVRGFSYHAAEDGEYWFALAHFDRRGQRWPDTAVRPQMRIVVDTIQPELQLSATRERSGSIVVRYEARDEYLDAKTLQIEARSGVGEWSAMAVGPADVAHRDRLVGTANWQPSSAAGAVEIRASIADRAGHRAAAQAEVALVGPSLRIPVAEEPLSEQPSPDEYGADPKKDSRPLFSHDWPIDNRLPESARADGQRKPLFVGPATTEMGAPPATNPYSTAARQPSPIRTPAQLVADGGAAPTPARSQSLVVTPLPVERPSPNQATSADNGWTQANSGAAAARMVNSPTFDIEYDLQSVGPWGVSKVELWGTHNGGQTWQSYGVDHDNRSPVRVTVPGAGSFGLRILVDGADGAAALPPRPGDEPELFVTVDLQPPTVELLAADLCKIQLADHLAIRWSAADTNLDSRPISLAYSTSPSGPWSTIAAGMENTGSYNWRIERHVPGRFYVRLEARDTAGNIATFQTPSPISLPRPQPTGRLRGVRPVNDAAVGNRVELGL